MQTDFSPADGRAMRQSMLDPAFRAKLRAHDPEALATLGITPADGDAAKDVKVVTDRPGTRYMAVDEIRDELTEADLAGVQAAGCFSFPSKARLNAIMASGTLQYPGRGDHISAPQRACRGCG